MEEDKMANAPQVTHEDDIGSYTAPVPKNVQKDEEVCLLVIHTSLVTNESRLQHMLVNRRYLLTRRQTRSSSGLSIEESWRASLAPTSVNPLTKVLLVSHPSWEFAQMH